MGHHVHCTDPKHGPVHIITMEHVIHIMFLVLSVKKNLLLFFISQIFTCSNQKTRRTACRITDDFICLRIHHFHHHSDNVPRCTELTIYACRSKFWKQIFIYIAPGVCWLNLFHLLINGIHSSHNLIQHQRSRYFKNCISHIFGIGTFLISMEIFDKRKYPLLHSAIHVCSRKIMKSTPFQLASINFSVSNLYFPGKYTLMWQTKHCRLFCTDIVCIIQIADKHQICHLLNYIQRISQSSCPE